jgi:hypothetical protein
MHPARLRLGQLLVDARILTAEQLEFLPCRRVMGASSALARGEWPRHRNDAHADFEPAAQRTVEFP